MKEIVDVTKNDNMREHVLEVAKRFKSSWVDLGRALYGVWKDKLYRDWGYQTFDGYVTKEIHIRKMTAMKLLRSYYFLEKEEPAYLRSAQGQEGEGEALPSFETIDVLRQAKNKDIDRGDYQNLKTQIFLKGKDAKEVRKDLCALIKEREELDPQEAWQKRKETQIKRFISTLKSLQREAQNSKMFSPGLLSQVRQLIQKLEDEV